jgi:AAA+ superfamily predicted ATPase
VTAVCDGAGLCTARVKLRALREVLWLRHLWDDTPGALGLSISFEEVERVLTDDHTAPAVAMFHAGDPRSQLLAGAIEAADVAAATDPRLEHLRAGLVLEDAEVDLLTLAIAAEADPWLRRVYSFIHDDATSSLASQWLARRLFDWPPATRIGNESGLVRWRLARPAHEQLSPWSNTAGWLVDPFVPQWLDGGAALDPELGDGIRLVLPSDERTPARCLYPDELATMLAFLEALEGEPPPREIVVSAPAGAGKRTLAAQLCAKLGKPLVIADAPVLLGTGVEAGAARDAVVRVERSVKLLDSALYWHDADAVGIARGGVAPAPITLLGTGNAPTHAVADGVVGRRVQLHRLTQADRIALWQSISSLPMPRPVLDWMLLPADVARAAAAAPAGSDAVVDACRASLRIESGALATSLPLPFTWDDIVLTDTVRQHVHELEAQARLRWPVYEGWGFGRLCPTGSGIAGLFTGPSGTGKTMAAQVLARELGMELLRIDLSAVVSKYIGETEKNLREVFDGCERANVLLLFDEADALFGRRMEVKDAHDRFANVEIDYLLQRMEQFEGITVLATNRKHEIDQAFLRRFRFIIDFLSPGVAERRELWRRSLRTHAPNGAPLLDGIDFDALAERLTMTGADIKNAALGAAFLAHAEDARIGMQHVVHAARRELAKRGEVVRAGDLG